jgi:hypothetical protein
VEPEEQRGRARVSRGTVQSEKKKFFEQVAFLLYLFIRAMNDFAVRLGLV